VFRQNTGQGWVGKIVRDEVRGGDRYITIKNPRPLYAGLTKGSSDIVGWTPEGLFLAPEVKSGVGRASADQARFLDAVNRAGGRAGVARSPEDAVAIATGQPPPQRRE